MSGLPAIAKDLSAALQRLRFHTPVTHVYDPSDYAWPAHREYLERFGKGSKEVVLLGMNPGPWGMAQTGVPFGEVSFVKDWLSIDSPVGRPLPEHPKRPVPGARSVDGESGVGPKSGSRRRSGSSNASSSPITAR